MIATERASYILNKLRDKNTVSLKEIASELDVSEATVRRDFERLDKEGFVVRVRSGAKRVEPVVPDHVTPLVTSEKLTEYTEEKNAIAKFAAGFVHDGDCVFLDGGTTIAPMIDFIQDKKIKIVTHNLLIPRRLKKMNVDIFLLGGHYTQFHESTMGVYTEKMVSQFHFDHAFFGCSGIELVHQMVYNDDIATVPVKEVAMKYSNKNYLLADSSKLGKTSFCRFSNLSAFDSIIVSPPQEQDILLPPNFIVVQND